MKLALQEFPNDAWQVTNDADGSILGRFAFSDFGNSRDQAGRAALEFMGDQFGFPSDLK